MYFFIFSFFKYIRNKIDYGFDKIQINKNFHNGSQLIILENTNISKGLKVLDNASRDDNLGSIFLKFELMTPDRVVCLKEYATKYRNSDRRFNNTLENIFIFNGVEVPENSDVNIFMISNKKRISKKISYEECKNWHISDFNKLEN